MKRLDNYILTAFLYGLPVAALSAVIARLCDPGANRGTGGLAALMYDLSGAVIGAMMLLAFYLCVRLMVSKAFRETVLARMTLIRERDEREVMLTGKAAKATMLTSLAILIFLFCLSCFQVSVANLPLEQAVGGHTKLVSFGVGFSLLDGAHRPAEEAGRQVIAYTGLPVSSSTVILGMIVWQIAAYNYSMRKMMK